MILRVFELSTFVLLLHPVFRELLLDDGDHALWTRVHAFAKITMQAKSVLIENARLAKKRKVDIQNKDVSAMMDAAFTKAMQKARTAFKIKLPLDVDIMVYNNVLLRGEELGYDVQTAHIPDNYIEVVFS